MSIALGEAITKGLPPEVEQLHSYLARIARLRAVDALRRRKHQADEPPDPATEPPARITPDGPEELAAQSEQASEIAAHLGGLPERERIALENTVCAVPWTTLPPPPPPPPALAPPGLRMLCASAST